MFRILDRETANYSSFLLPTISRSSRTGGNFLDEESDADFQFSARYARRGQETKNKKRFVVAQRLALFSENLRRILWTQRNIAYETVAKRDLLCCKVLRLI